MPWSYDDAYVDRLILDAIAAGHGDPVDLPTLLDRVDSNERWVPSKDELNASLQRLSEDGSVRQLAPGAFVDARRTTLGHPVRDLTDDDYVIGVRAYHAAFAADAAQVVRDPILQALAPRGSDLDAVAAQYAVVSVIAPFGGRVSRMSVRDDVVRLPIRDLDAGVDRDRIVAEIRIALERLGLQDRRVIVRFTDRREEIVAG